MHATSDSASGLTSSPATMSFTARKEAPMSSTREFLRSSALLVVGLVGTLIAIVALVLYDQSSLGRVARLFPGTTRSMPPFVRQGAP